MDLSQKTCTACKGGEPVLKSNEISKFLKQVSTEWQVKENQDLPAQAGKIVREFIFDNFNEAIEFVNSVAKIAENEGHHPNICLHSYKKVKIELWTHKIGGLHENDFIMAAKIDKLQ